MYGCSPENPAQLENTDHQNTQILKGWTRLPNGAHTRRPGCAAGRRIGCAPGVTCNLRSLLL